MIIENGQMGMNILTFSWNFSPLNSYSSIANVFSQNSLRFTSRDLFLSSLQYSFFIFLYHSQFEHHFIILVLILISSHFSIESKVSNFITLFVNIINLFSAEHCTKNYFYSYFRQMWLWRCLNAEWIYFYFFFLNSHAKPLCKGIKLRNTKEMWAAKKLKEI